MVKDGLRFIQIENLREICLRCYLLRKVINVSAPLSSIEKNRFDSIQSFFFNPNESNVAQVFLLDLATHRVVFP